MTKLFLLSCAMNFPLFFTTWIWSPVYSLVILYSIIFFDFFFALIESRQTKESFNWIKFWKWMGTLLFTMFILSICYNLPRLNKDFGYANIDGLLTMPPKFVYLMLFAYYLRSTLTNAALVGLFPDKLAVSIIKYLEPYKLERLMNKLHPAH